MSKRTPNRPRNSRDSANRLWRALLFGGREQSNEKNNTQDHQPGVIEMLARIPSWILIILAVIAIVIWSGVLR